MSGHGERLPRALVTVSDQQSPELSAQGGIARVPQQCQELSVIPVGPSSSGYSDTPRNAAIKIDSNPDIIYKRRSSLRQASKRMYS